MTVSMPGRHVTKRYMNPNIAQAAQRWGCALNKDYFRHVSSVHIDGRYTGTHNVRHCISI
jgi:hypothetical protein